MQLLPTPCAIASASVAAAASRATTSHRDEAIHRPRRKKTASEASGGVAMPPKWPIRVIASSAIRATPVMRSREGSGRFIVDSSGELAGWVIAQGDPPCATVLRVELSRFVVAPTDIGDLRLHCPRPRRRPTAEEVECQVAAEPLSVCKILEARPD